MTLSTKKLAGLTFLTVVGIFVLYASMLPDQLTGADFAGDSGDFLTAMLVGGIPHPTGYPTYTLLGQLFQRLPVGAPYTRGALLSALPTALAAGLLGFWLARWIVGQTRYTWVAALVAGVAAGVAPGIWSQAVIVEVYGLEALFVVLAMIWVAYLVNPDNCRLPLLVALAACFGLGLGNHVTLVLISPVLALAALLSWKSRMPVKWLAAQLASVFLGLLVYLYLPLAARGFPPVNWGNPQTLAGFLWEVTAKPYQGMVFGLELAKVPQRISALANLLWQQFGVLGLLLGIFGAVQFPFRRKFLQVAMLWIFLVYSVFAIGYRTDDSTAYLIPAYLVFAAWIGLGVFMVISLRWRAFPVGMGLAAIVAASILIQVPGNYRQVDPRVDTQPTDFARAYLARAPASAILLTSGDRDAFPLWYAHFGLKQRPDVAVVVLPLTQFAWYQETLRHNYPGLILPPLDAGALGTTRWGDQIPVLNPGRPICRSRVGNLPEDPIQSECQG
ncbi:MAG: DUF2723 domain-containing protein [Anaerolineaceae bacterium]|nr:DUF2723 domain-containing protein [Anaerolineaceae bacterium]